MAINHAWKIFCVMADAIQTIQKYANSNEMGTQQKSVWEQKKLYRGTKNLKKNTKDIKELTLKGKAKIMEYEKV